MIGQLQGSPQMISWTGHENYRYIPGSEIGFSFNVFGGLVVGMVMVQA